MNREELWSVAEIIGKLTERYRGQLAEHEAKMVEHRAAFGVRTEADAKIIAGLRAAADEQVLSASKVAYVLRCAGETPVQAAQRVVKERDGLLTQVQDQRAEIERLRNDERKAYKDADALRADVKDLRTLCNQWKQRETDLLAEIERLKKPRQHPVKAGEYVRRLTGFNTTLAGEIGRVNRVDDDAAEIEYEVKRQNGETGVWCAKNCEPCEPPEATHAEPDLTQLHAKGKEAWSDVPNATQWVEEMRGNTEATHDTEAGKAAAQNAEKTEQVADEIKVGDLVEVVSNRGRNTWLVDVGSLGIVKSVEDINDSISVHLDDVPGKRNALAGYVSFCDVRKVTT